MRLPDVLMFIAVLGMTIVITVALWGADEKPRPMPAPAARIAI